MIKSIKDSKEAKIIREVIAKDSSIAYDFSSILNDIHTFDTRIRRGMKKIEEKRKKQYEWLYEHRNDHITGYKRDISQRREKVLKRKNKYT